MNSRLEEYVTILEYFASNKYDKFDHSTPEINPDVAINLVTLGYLQGKNNSSMACPNAFTNVIITDSGKNKLKSWKSELNKKWLKKVLISNSERVFWLILGIILTLLAKKIF